MPWHSACEKQIPIPMEDLAVGTNQRSQITMADTEITQFVERSRVATMATVGPNGART